jgi:hypothetical protein
MCASNVTGATSVVPPLGGNDQLFFQVADLVGRYGQPVVFQGTAGPFSLPTAGEEHTQSRVLISVGFRIQGALSRRSSHRPVHYLTNIPVQDHRAIKKRICAKQHFPRLCV